MKRIQGDFRFSRSPDLLSARGCDLDDTHTTSTRPPRSVCINLLSGQGRRLKEAALLAVNLAVLELHCDFRLHIKLLRHVQVSPTRDLFLPPLTGIREPWRALTETSLVTIEAARSSNLQRNRPLSGGSLVSFILADRYGVSRRPGGNTF